MNSSIRRTHLAVLFAFGFALLAAMLFIHSSTAPGFQYDEAWWALLAHRISTDPSQRPLTGMSAYTSALPAYVTAAAFHWFGPKVAVFRGVAQLYVLGGIALISGALAVVGERRAAGLLPLVIAFFPALIMNQRWAVELNTLSVLCAGLISLGLAQRWKRGPSPTHYALILGGVALAITTHIFLFAPLLALWGCLIAGESLTHRTDRIVATLCALIVGAFGAYVYAIDPSRKEILLVIGASAAAAGMTWIDRASRIALRPLKWLCILSLPLFIPLAIHLDGNWQARQYVGFLENPFWQGAILLPLGLIAWCSRKSFRIPRPLPWAAAGFLPLTLIFTYSMVGRVGARFLEIPFLLAAVALAYAFSRLPGNRRWIALTLWCAIGAGQLWQNYFRPSIKHRQIAHTTRLWRIMKDSSEDFVSKTPQVDRLMREGCALSDLPPEARTLELTFLALADWPQPGSQSQKVRCRLYTNKQ